jgi:hypothetical protein
MSPANWCGWSRRLAQRRADFREQPKDRVMRNLSLSQIYAIGAAALLIVVVLVNRPEVTVIASAVGLVAGAFVLRRGDVRRVAVVAMAGFVAALALAVFALLR